jgi:hypothetical protein
MVRQEEKQELLYHLFSFLIPSQMIVVQVAIIVLHKIDELIRIMMHT